MHSKKKDNLNHNIAHTRIHLRMIIWISHRPFGYCLAHSALGPSELKVASHSPDWCGPLNLHLLFSLIFSQFWQRQIWAKITCNCGANCPCPGDNVKPVGSTTTSHHLAGNPTALIAQPMHNIHHPTIPYSTTFASVSAPNAEKSSTNIHI